MIKALRLLFYVNRPPRTLILQGDRRVRKGNRTIKVMDYFADRDKIKLRIKDIENRSKR